VNTETVKVEGARGVVGVVFAMPPMLIRSANFPQFISLRGRWTKIIMKIKGLP
jgi:hypothetical protein